MHSKQIKIYLVDSEYFTDEISNHRGQRHQEAHQPAVTGNQLCSGGFLNLNICFPVNTSLQIWPSQNKKYRFLFLQFFKVVNWYLILVGKACIIICLKVIFSWLKDKFLRLENVSFLENCYFVQLTFTIKGTCRYFGATMYSLEQLEWGNFRNGNKEAKLTSYSTKTSDELRTLLRFVSDNF